MHNYQIVGDYLGVFSLLWIGRLFFPTFKVSLRNIKKNNGALIIVFKVSLQSFRQHIIVFLKMISNKCGIEAKYIWDLEQTFIFGGLHCEMLKASLTCNGTNMCRMKWKYMHDNFDSSCLCKIVLCSFLKVKSWDSF